MNVKFEWSILIKSPLLEREKRCAWFLQKENDVCRKSI